MLLIIYTIVVLLFLLGGFVLISSAQAAPVEIPLKDSLNMTDAINVKLPTSTDIGLTIIVITIALAIWYLAFHDSTFVTFR